MSGFDSLKGIMPGVKATLRKLSVLEKIYKTCQRLDSKYHGKYQMPGSTYDIYGVDPKVRDHNERINTRVAEELQANLPEFSEQHVTEFAYALAKTGSNDSTFHMPWTGRVLEILAQRNRTQGKKTYFHFDGRDMAYSEVFSGLKSIDGLLIENCRAIEIGNYIMSKEGFADYVVLRNCQGFALGEMIAYEGGRCSVISITDCTFTTGADWIGSSGGSAGAVFIQGCTSPIGLVSIVGCGGKIDFVLINGNKTNESIGQSFALEGEINTTVISGNAAKKIVSNSFTSPKKPGGLYFVDNIFNVAFEYSSPNRIVMVGNSRRSCFKDGKPGEIIRGRQARQLYNAMLERNSEMLGYARAIRTGSPQEAIAAAMRLAERYKVK